MWANEDFSWCEGEKRCEGSLDVYVLLGSHDVIGRTCTFDHVIWANVQAYK